MEGFSTIKLRQDVIKAQRKNKIIKDALFIVRIYEGYFYVSIRFWP